MGEELMAAPIEDLELSVRSFNCLRRAGLFTVGELVSSIGGRDDLLRYVAATGHEPTVVTLPEQEED
jgi:DNA-directed RNA polymerase alpha subunit